MNSHSLVLKKMRKKLNFLFLKNIKKKKKTTLEQTKYEFLVKLGFNQ
jgi:hypothetical protein